MEYDNKILFWIIFKYDINEKIQKGTEEGISKGDVFYFKGIKLEIRDNMIKGYIYENNRILKIKRKDIKEYFTNKNDTYKINKSEEHVFINKAFIRKTDYLKDKLPFIQESSFSENKEGFFKIRGTIKNVTFIFIDYCLDCNKPDDCHNTVKQEITKLLFINNKIEKSVFFIGRFGEAYMNLEWIIFISRIVYNDECLYQLYGWNVVTE